jgi:hypothetical protein
MRHILDILYKAFFVLVIVLLVLALVLAVIA